MNNLLPGRILVHDHAGHAFTIGLSRELAARGWEVLHVYNAAFAGPKGSVTPRRTDPVSFTIRGLDAGAFPKYRLLRRVIAELRYSWALDREIRAFAPTILLSCNTPVIVAAASRYASARRHIAFVSWVQDIYHLAFTAYSELDRPHGVPDALHQRIAALLAAVIRRVELTAIDRSTGIVTISEALALYLASSGVRSQVRVLENWAPVEELPYHPEITGAIRHRLGLTRHHPLALYAGTLGAKHRTEWDALIEVAQALSPLNGHLVVLTEGVGAELLRAHATEAGLDNITVLPFATHEELPSLLADADVLLAVLDPDAATYSVPSKVLTYLCAGRPIVASISADNTAAHTILKAGAGSVCEPRDVECFVGETLRYIMDPSDAMEKGQAGRSFAEAHFQIAVVADKFESALAEFQSMRPF